MDEQDKNHVDDLKCDEHNLWLELEELHPDSFDSAKQIVSKLIEVNIELEKYCNQ